MDVIVSHKSRKLAQGKFAVRLGELRKHRELFLTPVIQRTKKKHEILLTYKMGTDYEQSQVFSFIRKISTPF